MKFSNILSRLNDASRDKRAVVAVTENNRDVDTFYKAGVDVAYIPESDSVQLKELQKALRQRDVMIITRNDEAGRLAREDYAVCLHDATASIRVLDLSAIWPSLPPMGDFTSLKQEFGGAAFTMIAEQYNTAPDWRPANNKQASNGNKPKLIKAASVDYEPPNWLIAPYFQRGKGTLIQADNGTGKTAFMCAVAALVSSGRPLIDQPIQTPGNVLLLSVEDDLPILRGRIEASGGDLEKCHFLTNAAGLTFNSPEVEEAIKEIGARLIVFDPLQAFLGSDVDMFRANETRPELAKLFEMAGRNDCAVGIIAHTSKGGLDKSPVNRALGSVDIPASMRSILQLIRNPDDDSECIAIHVKSSNAPKGQSIAFEIGDRGGVHWRGYSPLTADDLYTIQKRKEREEKGVPYDQEPLVQVFRQLMTDKPGGGFWSYADLKMEGAQILGFPPYSDLCDFRNKINSSLAKELQQRDGLIVTAGVKSNGVRGIRVEQYKAPNAYQTKISV